MYAYVIRPPKTQDIEFLNSLTQKHHWYDYWRRNRENLYKVFDFYTKI